MLNIHRNYQQVIKPCSRNQWNKCVCPLYLHGRTWRVSAQGPVLTMMSGEQCFGSRVDLLCIHPDPFANPDKYIQQTIAWAEDNATVDFRDPANVKRFTLTRVNSTASTLSFNVTEEEHRDRVILCNCFLVRNNANLNLVESNTLLMNPKETTAAPVITSVPTSTSDVLQWSHHPDCTNDYTFQFSVIWMTEDGIHDGMSSGTFTTATNEYDFSNLTRGNYSITIKAQCIEYAFIVSEPVNVNIRLTSELLISPGNPSESTNMEEPFPLWIVIVVVVLAVIILMIIIGLITVCVYRKKSKTQPENTVPPPAPPKDDLYGKVVYAQLEHSPGHPAAAPSLGTVVYTEAKQVVHRPPPAVPTPYKGSSEKDDKAYSRQGTNKSDDFNMKIITILQEMNIIQDPVKADGDVLGTYQSMTFVVKCVYIEEADNDLSEEDVDNVVTARKQHQNAKGLLIANASTIPDSLLQKLEECDCHFIGLGGKGEATKDMLMKKIDFVLSAK